MRMSAQIAAVASAVALPVVAFLCLCGVPGNAVALDLHSRDHDSPKPIDPGQGERAVVPASPQAAGLPRIGFSDSTLVFETVRGASSPPGQGFDLLNTSDVGTLNWTLEVDRFFLAAGPLSGSSNNTRVSVWVIASTDLLVGVHPAHVIVSSSNAVNSPETVFVQVRILCPIPLTGDVTGDGAVSQSDIVYLVNHVLKAGPAPVPLKEAGDVNCDRNVGLADVIFLVNYVLKGGAAPCDACILL